MVIKRWEEAPARLLVLESLLESSQVLATTTPQIRYHLYLFIIGNSICFHHSFTPSSYNKCYCDGRVFATTTFSDV